MGGARFVRFLDDDATAPDPGMLGGKCASLAGLAAAGLPVPRGFAVTTEAYAAFVRETGAGAEIAGRLAGLEPGDLAAVDAVSAGIRGSIRRRPLPGPVRAEVVAAYQALQERLDRMVAVAVRSSATAEDLPGASFAGQQDTYLWLRGVGAVLHHVRECWASLYTSRAILYRLWNGVPDDGLAMAVAVQRMVNSRAAGVAITLHPATGDRSKIVLDASYGVGELVVSGRVTPDNVVVDKVMLTVVAETIGAKHAELVPDTARACLVERPVEAARRARRSIGDGEVRAVAALAKRAERHFGCPQDVEWAIDAEAPDGRNLVLLQSRPETVHSAKPPGAVAAPPAPGTSNHATHDASTETTDGTPSGFSMAGLVSALTNRTQP